MTLRLRRLGAALVVLILVACGSSPDGMGDGASDALAGTLLLTGSSTAAPLASEIGRRFETLHPRARIDIQTGGSSRGIADAANGLADIGMSSRDLRDSETDGLRQWSIVMDGVGFLVHADNSVDELTSDQLAAIFTGAVDDWREVGGTAGPITVINRADGRSELDLVTDYFSIERSAIDADLIAGENQQGIKMVANDPRAITYMSIGASQFEADNGASIKLLPLEGVEASVDTVAAGTFPLSRPLTFVTIDQPTALATAFIDYAQSEAVHDLAVELSYVPIRR